MSHFAVMVIGDNVEEQLSKYDESIEVEEYCKGEVPEDEQKRMMGYYESKKGETFSSFDECYTKYGKDWNDNRYRKDSDGKWKVYSTYNPLSKWDWWQVGGRFSGAFITHIKKDVKVSDSILILKQYARMLKLMQENAIVILRDYLRMEKYQR